MPSITSVEPQKSSYAKASERRRIRRFNIFIDGQFAFGADEDLVVNSRLIPGKEILKEELENLLYEAEVGKLMDRMYGLFSVRQRSEKEVRDYLKNLSFKRKAKEQEEISQASIDLVIERLKQKEMINDLEFAKAWIESRRRSKQKGINFLKAELYQKGIERGIIEEVVQKEPGSGEEELARLALKKKMKVWKNLDSYELKRKAIEFLVRRGFDYQLARDVVEKILKKE